MSTLQVFTCLLSFGINLSEFKTAFSYNIEDFNTIKFVIESHSLDDNKDYEILKKYDIIKENRALRILKIIKDADALDRVREYPYLNIKYLRTDSSKKLVSFSCELFNSYNVNSR